MNQNPHIIKSVDVIVIGGGPAGLMAAYAAASKGAETLLLEKGNKLGRKLGISGGGRCNVTNAKPLDALMDNIPGNGRFLYAALTRFGNTDIMRFFEGLGIRLKEEDRGRVFPVSDKAATVVKAMVDAVYDSGVQVWTETPVRNLMATDGQITGAVLRDGRIVSACAVVVATGGCSVPKTGSTGDAYPWAEALGHRIVEPYPTEVPLVSDEPLIRDRVLQGLSLRGVDVTIRTEKGKRLTTENGDLLFTHLGLSGPAALRCSHYVSTALRRDAEVKLFAEINCLPGASKGSVTEEFQQLRVSSPKRHLHNVLEDWFPERLAGAILQQADTAPDMQLTHLPNTAMERLATLITAFPLSIRGTLPLEQATVTGGGVSVKDVDPKTLASKRCEGLYFCGEVMDVHAHTGGYNITVAFSTGHAAGTSAAAFSRTIRR